MAPRSGSLMTKATVDRKAHAPLLVRPRAFVGRRVVGVARTRLDSCALSREGRRREGRFDVKVSDGQPARHQRWERREQPAGCHREERLATCRGHCVDAGR